MEIRKDYRQYFLERIHYSNEETSLVEAEDLLERIYQNFDEITKEESKKRRWESGTHIPLYTKKAFLDTAICLHEVVSLEAIAELKPYEFYQIVKASKEHKLQVYYYLTNDDNWYVS